ncbi:hypothetical protein [Subtercola endophyticus]|uniref:hypothetical protein n=1 Tax=Subtercola endophyticus TaxID=2895559 RepID=UPI001E513E5C|nr:hypothetical protein [Subtercola endophyticus]UFS59138.1 hypothetical protein LQ955_19540 [Subtercola endophyticus]
MRLSPVEVFCTAITAVETAIAALGNPGLTRNNPLERHRRDVLASRVHPPQDDAALLVAGHRVLATYMPETHSPETYMPETYMPETYTP